jgi:hypothetical protein
MQYTRYMDQCRRRLLEAIEMQTDYSADIMLDLQNVCLDAHDTFTLYDFENAEVSGDLAIKSLVGGLMERLRAVEEKSQSQRGSPLLRESAPPISPAVFLINIKQANNDFSCMHEHMYTKSQCTRTSGHRLVHQQR